MTQQNPINKRSRHRFLVGISFISLSLFSANNAFSSDIMTWEDCVNLATQNNGSLRAAIASQKASNYSKDATLSEFLPEATANLSSTRGRSTTGNVADSHNGSLTLRQNLFSGFGDVGRFDEAKANNMIAKANVNITKAQVSYDLKSNYQTFVYAKDTVTLLDAIIKRREDNLQIIELRYRGGMENKGSLLLAQAYLEQAKYDRLQGENLIESARAGLCRVLGINECSKFDIVGAIPTKDPKENKSDFARILDNIPEHQQAIATEEAAKAGITIARSGFFPSLDVSVTKGQSGPDFFPNDDYWSAGVNLSFPFFSGGRDYNSTLGAYSRKTAATETRLNTDRQILANLQRSYNSYLESSVKLKVDKGFQEAAKMRADIARNKYNNGLLNFENWDSVETDLINREKSYLQSKRDRVINEAAWEQVQGKGVFYND